MRGFSLLSIGLLMLPFLAEAQTAGTLSVLQRDLSYVQSLLSRDAQAMQWETDDQVRTASTDLLPAMSGGEIALTAGQKNVLRRCDAVTLPAQVRRCEAIKCRLLGQCRGR